MITFLARNIMLYLACPIENLTWDSAKNRWQNSSVQISVHKTYQYTHMDINGGVRIYFQDCSGGVKRIIISY